MPAPGAFSTIAVDIHKNNLIVVSGVNVDVEDTEELLRQFVQDALLVKTSGGGTKLYDQCVSS